MAVVIGMHNLMILFYKINFIHVSIWFELYQCHENKLNSHDKSYTFNGR